MIKLQDDGMLPEFDVSFDEEDTISSTINSSLATGDTPPF